jgi:hypothetical protein
MIWNIHGMIRPQASAAPIASRVSDTNREIAATASGAVIVPDTCL